MERKGWIVRKRKRETIPWSDKIKIEIDGVAGWNKYSIELHNMVFAFLLTMCTMLPFVQWLAALILCNLNNDSVLSSKWIYISHFFLLLLAIVEHVRFIEESLKMIHCDEQYAVQGIALTENCNRTNFNKISKEFILIDAFWMRCCITNNSSFYLIGIEEFWFSMENYNLELLSNKLID